MWRLFICTVATAVTCSAFHSQTSFRRPPSVLYLKKTSDLSDGDDENGRIFRGSSRRDVLSTTTLLLGTALAPSVSTAADASSMMAGFMSPQPASSGLEVGMLESRVSGNALNPPPYGLENTDVFYPKWFLGSWNTRSVTRDVQAPCGVALVGGEAAYQRMRTDIGNELNYASRFVSTGDGKTIADREFNVRSIAKAAMGEYSVLEVSTATPNKFSCLLAPAGSNSTMAVDLLVLNRRQERISDDQFDCSEVAREIATPMNKPRQPPSLIKEIETTSLYTYLPETDEVRCQQRSAAFLLPSNENPMAMRMWQVSQGRAIDVRYYDVYFTRK